MSTERGALLIDFSWWVVWARPLLAGLSGLVLLLLALVCLAAFGRRLVGSPADAIWPVRAARAGEVRSAFIAAQIGAFVGVALIVDGCALLSSSQKASLLLAVLWLGKIVATQVTDAWERRVLCRPIRKGRGWDAELLAILLLGSSVAYVAWLPRRYDVGGLLWLALGAFALVGLQSNWANGLVRRIMFDTPRPQAVDAVTRAATAMNAPIPRVFETRSAHVNAFALHGANAVAFSDAAIELLTPSELEAAAAHELGHLSEPRWARALRATFALRPLLLVAFAPLLDESRALFCGLASWLTAGFLQRAFSRWMERRADAAASGNVGGPDYAKFLERLYELNLMSGQTATTHPTLAERAKAVGGRAPRARARGGGTFAATGWLVAVGIVLTLSISSGAIRDGATLAEPAGPEQVERFVSLRGDTAAMLLAGSYWAEQGHLEKSMRLLRAAKDRQSRFEASLLRAGLLARDRSCPSARTVVAATLRDCRTPDDCEVIGQHRCWATNSSLLCRQLLKRELAAFWTQCPASP